MKAILLRVKVGYGDTKKPGARAFIRCVAGWKGMGWNADFLFVIFLFFSVGTSSSAASLRFGPNSGAFSSSIVQ